MSNLPHIERTWTETIFLSSNNIHRGNIGLHQKVVLPDDFLVQTPPVNNRTPTYPVKLIGFPPGFLPELR